MKATTVVLMALIMAASGAVVWSGTSLLKRISVVEHRLAAVTAGMEPIHLRCDVLGGLLEAAQVDLATVEEASAVVSGTVASHAALISEDRSQLQVMEGRLVRAREEASRSASELQATMDGQAQRAREAEERLAQLALQIRPPEAQIHPVPAGTILPWIPNEEGVPAGWLLCDGSLGTPDLRGRFLRGVGRFQEAGRYSEGAEMLPAGVHSHATDSQRSMYTLTHTASRSPGDWLLLFDTGMGDGDPEMLARHGSHVHEDEHLPAHFTVVFIMKDSR